MDWFLVGVSFLGIFAILKACLVVLTFGIKELAKRKREILVDRLFSEMDSSANLLLIIVAAYITAAVFFPDFTFAKYDITQIFIIFGVLVVAYSLNCAIKIFLEEYEEATERKIEFVFLKHVSWAFIYLIAILMIFVVLGVDVTPVLAGLGIAGIALALALQDPLKNFFAGIYIVSEKPFRIGDFIIVDGDEKRKGTVVSITGRTTKILSPRGNLLMIPNAKLAESIVERIVPEKLEKEKEEALETIKVNVAYGTNLKRVENAIKRILKRLIKKKLILKTEPAVFVNELKDYGIELAVSIKVEKKELLAVALSEFRKEVLMEFKREKIEIPYPTHVAYVKT